MISSLKETQIQGIETNLFFLQEVLQKPQITAGTVTTKTLEQLSIEIPALEVLDGGLNSTLQDYPGRVGYWGVGVPPSGSMDALSGRIANKILNNSEEAPVIELTLSGGKWLFRGEMEFALAGAHLTPTLDGQPVPMYQVVTAKAGQVLSFGESKTGMRCYLAVKTGSLPQKYWEVLRASRWEILAGKMVVRCRLEMYCIRYLLQPAKRR